MLKTLLNGGEKHTLMLSLGEIGALIAKYRKLRGRARQKHNEEMMQLPETEIRRIRQRAAASCEPCGKCGFRHESGEVCP